jgi:hypothetical protein
VREALGLSQLAMGRLLGNADPRTVRRHERQPHVCYEERAVFIFRGFIRQSETLRQRLRAAGIDWPYGEDLAG